LSSHYTGKNEVIRTGKGGERKGFEKTAEALGFCDREGVVEGRKEGKHSLPLEKGAPAK